MARDLLRLLALVAVALTADRIHAEIDPAQPVAGDESLLPQPAFAKAFAAGFEALLSDYHWIQVVQHVGDPAVIPSEHTDYIGSAIEVVTELDPWVDHPYRFAAIWLTGSARDVTRGNALLRNAIEYHPAEWRNYFYLGFNLFFYLGENAEAAEVLSAALPLAGAPPYLPRLVARLRSQTADLESAEVFLRQMLQDNSDAERSASLRAALDEIEVERKARFLDRAREHYRKLNGRDIERVEDLTAGPHPVLRGLPPAEPSSTPASLRRGAHWTLSEDGGQIVSSYYGSRYEVHIHSADKPVRERIQAEAKLIEGDAG